MTDLPTYDQIIALHKRHAPSEAAFRFVFTHCEIVWQLAQQLIGNSALPVNRERVQVGCLLHDIGVYQLYLPDGSIDHKNYIKHGTIGYDILKAEGFDEAICRFASCHTGVGLSKQDVIAERIPIPPADYFANTIEERLIMYADKFHTKTTPPQFMTADTYADDRKKFGEAKVEKFRKLQREFGLPNLKAIAETYGFEIV